ncbi:MAG: hypothetical protein LBP35_05450 [Candidatus Ancillula trichonymphae]|nr:hypothetical protein [Candidatus Ancillula trichonymphae]
MLEEKKSPAGYVKLPGKWKILFTTHNAATDIWQPQIEYLVDGSTPTTLNVYKRRNSEPNLLNTSNIGKCGNIDGDAYTNGTEVEVEVNDEVKYNLKHRISSCDTVSTGVKATSANGIFWLDTPHVPQLFHPSLVKLASLKAVTNFRARSSQ